MRGNLEKKKRERYTFALDTKRKHLKEKRGSGGRGKKNINQIENRMKISKSAAPPE